MTPEGSPSLDDELLAQAKDALSAPRLSIAEAFACVPRVPGLYAVHGDSAARSLLDRDTETITDRPLYVGKAERSLNSRDLKTHFASGKTGSSTLRRSCAALLADALHLEPIPRNKAKPDGSANFGLAPIGDQLLTEWMCGHLSLCVWISPLTVVLEEIEARVISDWQPPLNLDKVLPGSRKTLKAARAQMAARARSWVEQ